MRVRVRDCVWSAAVKCVGFACVWALGRVRGLVCEWAHLLHYFDADALGVRP